jgi:uncharacterized membrane protein
MSAAMPSAIASNAGPPQVESLTRLDSIDLVRGLVMVVMLLDHMRDFTHWASFTFDPLDNTRTTPILYATRWITHLCAPTFVFLAGLGAGLGRLRGKPAASLARFLWTRGAWLVFLEVTVVRTLIWFNWHPSLLAQLQVIWAIGVSMTVLAALVRLPMPVVGTIGVLIVLGHNLLDRFQVAPFVGPQSPLPSPLGPLWMLFHQGGFFPVHGFPSPMVLAQYPVLPWAGVLLAGYGAACFYTWPGARRRRTLVGLGAGMLLAFFTVRFTNLYGDPVPWASGADATKTVMAFLDVAKYPPSALYVLVTLGLSITLLGALDGRIFRRGLGAALVTFGRVPLFFYLLQWITAHLAGMLVTASLGKDISVYFMNFVQIVSAPKVPDYGGPLRATYLCWALGVLLLYFPCRWFAGVKARRRDWWLSYV